MEVTSHRFRAAAAESLANVQLQRALARIPERFVAARARAAAEFGEFEQLRAAGAAIRERALARLDVLLERFEAEAVRRGARVHWAVDAAEANRIVLDIARGHGVRRIVKSKSMVTEECALNDALETAGLEVLETDLGEYILQLARERPSHIIAPVIHKNREEVTELFSARHRRPRSTDIAALCQEAREILRPQFFAADMGITGANFLVAETGSVALFTNEGNGRLVTTLPRVHVAVAGIEKVVETLGELAALARLLPRSATGQAISNYFTLLTGVRGATESDGPEAFHIVLLDNGRSRLLGSELHPILRCIRCGACLNHCPVYQTVGGHAYGWVYPGPMGAVWTPALVGLERARELPEAATFCGQCQVACPVMIPLPDLLRRLRTRATAERLRPARERLALNLWGCAARHPRLYALLTALAARMLYRLGHRRGWVRRLPLAAGWTATRDFPAGEGRTAREVLRRERSG